MSESRIESLSRAMAPTCYRPKPALRSAEDCPKGTPRQGAGANRPTICVSCLRFCSFSFLSFYRGFRVGFWESFLSHRLLRPATPVFGPVTLVSGPVTPEKTTDHLMVPVCSHDFLGIYGRSGCFRFYGPPSRPGPSQGPVCIVWPQRGPEAALAAPEGREKGG